MGQITAIVGTHADNTLDQLKDVATRADFTALMPDGHLGYIMPVGGVAAYEGKTSVAGVGFDIACGNCAIRTDRKHTDFTPLELEELAHEITRSISFGVGRTNKQADAPVDHPLFDDPRWGAYPGSSNIHNLQGKARAQLGTVGSGNHYVDVLVDEDGWLWVGVHFGSRGLGHTTATGFMNLVQGKPWDARGQEVEALIGLNTPLGDAYWSAMELAGLYAYAGREYVTRKVVGLLGGTETFLVHNHHNFAWKEQHFGRDLVVVRKGATPAWPGQYGFVGGSMGDDAVILRGKDSDEGPARMYSTVHGAGRVMSRTQAAGKRNRRTGAVIKPGLVSQAMMEEWLAGRGVILKGGGLDESPHAYRRLPDVLRDCGDTVEIVHTLRPVIVVMAGANEFDPYKD